MFFENNYCIKRYDYHIIIYKWVFSNTQNEYKIIQNIVFMLL